MENMIRPSHMPESRIGGAFKLFALFGIEIAFVVVLHMLGSIDSLAVDFSNIKVWMDTTPPEIALVASIRLLALVFAYWLIATSFLYMGARAFNIGFLVRTLELTTVPGVRRVIDAGLAAAIVGGTVFGGAGAVFAKSSDAQVNAVPAAITSVVKESRVLYNPTPVGDVLGAEFNSANATNESTNFGPSIADSSNDKVVVASTETPAPAQVAPTQDTTTPQKDANGNYIPTPSGGAATPTEGTIVTPDDQDSGNDKVVIEPTPSESSTTTTTAPKVTVPTTSPPVVSDSEVQVGGQQVQRPNDTTTPTQAPSSYTVVSGDNFWNIAKTQVENSLGRDATDTEVANYWVKLIEANRANISSGDPDLIFPGEVFTLPPL